ncbi:MAG: J domain-containing protein, partial [Myxococcota bacterium]
MSAAGEQIDGLGRAGDRLRPNPEFDPTGHPFDRDSYFVWSRIDGVTTIRDLILMVGLPADRTVDILRRLRAHGALLRPGETPASVARQLAEEKARAARAKSASATPSAQSRPSMNNSVAATPPGYGSTASPPTSTEGPASSPAAPIAKPTRRGTDPGELGPLSAEEETAMAVAADVSEGVKRRIIATRRTLARASYFEVLGVAPEDDKRTVKRAYRRLSKVFHPDRYYGKELGPFAPWLSEIF